MVTVYTSSGCSYCELVLSFFTKHNIPFEEKNISKDMIHFREWKALNVQGTPTACYKGEMVVGFDGDLLKAFIEKIK